MRFHVQKEQCQIKLFTNETSKKERLMSLTVCRDSANEPTRELIIKDKMHCQPDSRCNIDIFKVNGTIMWGWKVSNLNGNGWKNWQIDCKPSALIFPTREGERIRNLRKFPLYDPYKLSYPGTASTKCIVVFTGPQEGFVVGSEPSLNWAELKIRPIGDDKFIINFFQSERDLYLLPFHGRWQTALNRFRQLAISTDRNKSQHDFFDRPRFMLQMGMRDPQGQAHMKFPDLIPMIRKFRHKLGKGNIVHLFGTNKAGFDNMLPDFTIDRRLGGRRGLTRLVDEIQSLGLLTSHHFNPRIASKEWMDNHPQFETARILNSDGNPWIEFYKGHEYYVMNPSNEAWLSYCIEKVRYFKNIGFDYVQLDQIAYQRNLANSENDIGKGFQRLIDLTDKEGVLLWIEGVSDIYKLPPGAFFQILPRDRFQIWRGTQENRRGYPFGRPHPQFYRHLMPKAPVSFQFVTEKFVPDEIPRRLTLARKLGAVVLDLELGFVDPDYPARFDSTIKQILPYKNKIAAWWQ